MSASQFSFLRAEFVDEFEAAERAERYALSDPGTAVIHARRSLESAVKWMFTNDIQLPQPYEDKLNAYLNDPAFKSLAEGRAFSVAKKIQRAGNRAVHESKPPTTFDAVEIVSALFQFSLWFAFTCGRTARPDLELRFDPELLEAAATERSSLAERQELEARLESEAEETELARRRLAEATRTIEELESDRAKLIAEVAAAKKTADAVPDDEFGWSEWETRKYKIDGLLAEAGYSGLEMGRDLEYEVSGMPNKKGLGYVDYVLWGADGKPLAVVEAKKTTVSPTTGQQQAKLYADCLEAETGQRPIIFYTNGYEHWLWDDTQYPPRQAQGFYTKDELALLIQRRTSKASLALVGINDQIVERYYQRHAIRSHHRALRGPQTA